MHSDRLSGHRLRIFYRVPAFLPVSLRFSDVSGHNPVVVLRLLDIRENVRGAIKTTDKDIAKTALLAKGFREAGQTVANKL